MNQFRADLHCHSTCSDGSKTPEELVKLAKEIGLSGLSITDHDSIEAYTTAMPLAQAIGIEMITGVEFSTVHKTESIHILGYAFSLESPILHDFCQKHHNRRLNRNHEILVRLKKHGMLITEADIEESLFDPALGMNRTIGRPHIANAMVKKGYVTSIQDAFKKYLAEDKCCYAPGESFSTAETIDIIHQAGGIAIIAHPHLIENGTILRELLEMNFDGIECYYAKFPMDKHTRWLEIAQKKNWLITGGSDFHGEIKPNLPLGSSFVDEHAFRLLQRRSN